MKNTLPDGPNPANETRPNYVRQRKSRRALTWAISDLRRGRRTPRQTLDLLQLDESVRRMLGSAIYRYTWDDCAPLDRERSEHDRPVFELACVGLYLIVLQSVQWGACGMVRRSVAGGSRPRALGPIVGEAKAAKQLGVSRRMIVHAKRALEKAGVLRGWQPPAHAVPEWARCRPKQTKVRGRVELVEFSYWCVELTTYCGHALRRRLMRWEELGAQARAARGDPLPA